MKTIFKFINTHNGRRFNLAWKPIDSRSKTQHLVLVSWDFDGCSYWRYRYIL